ncbi:MAG TPA: S9 family peptidase [Caulobacteraceae bacterium]
MMRWPFCAAAALTVAGAAQAAPPIDDYGKLPAVEQMNLSPDGDKITYIAAAGGARQVIVAKAGGGVLLSVGVGILKPRVVKWLGDDHILIVTSRTVATDRQGTSRERFEAAQSTVIDAATGKPMIVFGHEPRIVHATFNDYGHAFAGGREYGYFAGVPLAGSGTGFVSFDTQAAYLTKGHPSLYKVDLVTGHAEMVFGGSERLDTNWVVGSAGQVTAHSEYDEKTGQWALFADPADQVRVSEAVDPIHGVEVVGQGRDDATVLVERPADDGKGDWAYLEYPLSAEATGSPPFGASPIRDLLTNPDSGFLIGAVTDGDDPKTLLLDPALQAKFDKVSRLFAGETVTLVSATGDLSRMVVFTRGPGDSGTYFLADLAAGVVRAIGWAYPTILQGDVAESRIVSYRAADGQTLQGVLTLPPGRLPKGLPLVVLPHGGPQARDYLGFDWWAQAFASRGYAVLQPNFRGSDGFGKAFRDAGFGQWGRKMQTDISDGVAALAAQGIVDAKRACIVGGSYGGYAALAGVTVQQGLYRCAVSVGGVSDLTGMLAWDVTLYGERNARMRYERPYLGVTGPGDATLRAISPLQLAGRADAPILLIWGADDTVVPIDQSRDMRSALQHAGKTVEALELPHEDHWLSRQDSRFAMIEASVAFVEKYNPVK